MQHQDTRYTPRHRAYSMAPKRPDGVGRARGVRSRRDFRSLLAFAIARSGGEATAVEVLAFMRDWVGKGVA